jgi:hypothetical protein
MGFIKDLIFKKGKFKGKSVYDTDPYYARFYVEQEEDFVEYREAILVELDKKIKIYMEDSAPLVKMISQHIMMSNLTGNKRGLMFLHSIKSTIERGARIYPRGFNIISDILARGFNIKPHRRNSKKYKNILAEVVQYRNIVTDNENILS